MAKASMKTAAKKKLPAKISGKKPRPHWRKDWKKAEKAWNDGLAVRRAMFGPAGAENQIADTSDFIWPMQDYVTRRCFGETWTRPTLNRKTRSLITLGMKPYDGSAILEINPSLVFPIVEMLLGGNGKALTQLTREVTEIEQSVLEGVLRVILNDLRAAWTPVASIEFSLEAQETEPQLLQILAQNEAVVAIGIEVRIGEASGMMNLGIPSIVIKMLRQKFDQHRTVRKSLASGAEQERVLKLVRPAQVHLDVRMSEKKVSVPDLLSLREGDILQLDQSASEPFELYVNGARKFRGEVVGVNGRRALRVSGDRAD